MKLTTWTLAAIIASLSFANPLLEANSTGSPQGEKEQLAREFVAYANQLAVARDNRN